MQVRLLVFALDTLKIMAKNTRRKLDGEMKHDAFHVSLCFFVLTKCCALNTYYFDLRYFCKLKEMASKILSEKNFRNLPNILVGRNPADTQFLIQDIFHTNTYFFYIGKT